MLNRILVLRRSLAWFDSMGFRCFSADGSSVVSNFSVLGCIGFESSFGLFCICIPRGPKVVPFWGSYIESYKVTPKRNYFGASG